MQSIECDNHFDCGYADIISKTISNYEKRFDKNELKYNKFNIDLANNANQGLADSVPQSLQHIQCFSLAAQLKRSANRQTDRTAKIQSNNHTVIGCEREPNSVYAGIFKAKHVKQFRERCVVNGKYLHKCKWKDCHYETHFSNSIVRHIHVKHIGIKELKCVELDCGKTFARPESLAEHQNNHLCGFRIDVNKYKFGDGLCSYYNIKKYYKRERVNEQKQKKNQYSYHCEWADCHFSSLYSDGMMTHIHSQHICPNRAKPNTK